LIGESFGNFSAIFRDFRGSREHVDPIFASHQELLPVFCR